MKGRSYSLSIIIAFLYSMDFSFSQTLNLVPNPGFEEYNYLPDDRQHLGISCAVGWKRNPVSIGIGDYYHDDSKTKHYKTGKNILGKQLPHSGKAFAGICITKKFREYLQADLITPLKKDKQYKISIFISRADRFYLGTVDEFDILFSKKAPYLADKEYFQGSPSIKFINEKKYKDKKHWIELIAVYTAKGDEKAITFGSLLYKERAFAKTTEHGRIHGLIGYAHYYVDDISITPLQPDSTAMVTELKAEKPYNVSVPDFIIGKTYVFKNIQFETAKSELLAKAYPELENLVSYLQKNESVRLLISGHTDNIGKPEDNRKLSYDRAKTIKFYLVSKEIDEKRISIEGKGDTYPIADNNTDEGREQNRRVEISFL